MGRQAVNQQALSDLIESSGIKPRSNSRSWIFDCPKCGKSKKLYMLRQSGRFVCWVCAETIGFRGSPEFALTELLGRPLSELRRILYGDEAIQSQQFLVPTIKDFFDNDEEVDDDASEIQPVNWPVDYYPINHKFSARGLAYLQGRGIDLELALKYGLRYCPPMRRVIFPIQYEGQLYGWQGRAIFDTELHDPETGSCTSVPKVLTTKGLKKEYMLMYMDNLTNSQHAVLTEGPIDGIKCWQAGGNVASMGKAISAQQIGLLRNSGIKKIYLALDRDAATEIYRVAKEFHDIPTYLMLAPRPWHDHGEMTPEACLQTFQNAEVFVPGVNIIDSLDSDFEAVQARALRWRKRNNTRRLAR